MTTSRIILTTSKISILDIDDEAESAVSSLPPCKLKWRQKQLWVLPVQKNEQHYLPPLQSQSWLSNCLQRSSVGLVCIDPNVGETGLRVWTNACEQAKKKAVLRVPFNSELSSREKLFRSRLKRMMDSSLAALLLLILSPVLLGLMLLIAIVSPGPVFSRQWRAGERGKLFQVIKFRTEGIHKGKVTSKMTHFGKWLRQYCLDGLPQLVNVLRGEMSLVGPRPWKLDEVIRMTQEERRQLRLLPGMIRLHQEDMRSHVFGSQSTPVL
ncbi:sugar transferase [Moorena producens JHB]|uniref:Sugar transferase n=1 Tax=Moorena producens (strain JHB) TaxID=1454205 RepID=A0A1D9G565_MOOP1|nr:heterocyst development glycosyltransferase HepC [Moorena producens]AOY82560.1 sugar transferase [Moorena producens JHB]